MRSFRVPRLERTASLVGSRDRNSKSNFWKPGTDGDVAQLRGSIHDLDTSNIQQLNIIDHDHHDPSVSPGGL